MKNLDQIRARQALNFWANTRNEEIKGDNCAQILREVSFSLLNNGLLAAIAFARDKSSIDHRGGHEELVLEVGRYLASKERALLPFPVHTTDDLVRGLTGHPSTLLQSATLEAVAYLGYLNRFRSR
ncbi:MAG: type III-B CRISPR module-associated protein Cmr5 [Candidatus Omnitrophica bacterium]|nr:type III-B CRISPR module-associated protein Cmr5 [Candidatus Omnitrophota bacterium]